MQKSLNKIKKEWIRKFSKYASLMWNYGSRIVLLLQRHVKYGLISKILVSKNATAWWLEKPLRITVNFYKKQYLSVITWAIKYSLKQVISITYLPEKKFFCSCYFWRFVRPFFSEIVRNCSLLWSVMSIFYISREQKTK